MNIGLYVGSDSRRKQMRDDLEALFNANDIFSAKVSSIKVDASLVASVKTPAKLEQIISKDQPVKPGDLLVIEWKSLKDEILVTSDRTIFISENVGKWCEAISNLQLLLILPTSH